MRRWHFLQPNSNECVLVYSGIIAKMITGKRANAAAPICAKKVLKWPNHSAGDLENPACCIHFSCYVAHQGGFDAFSEVANGASNKLNEILRNKGLHACSVIGVKSLPRNAPVVIKFTAALYKPTTL
jgi:enamine deaminase RidA (YjgF/YER057c/UK114 family)